jgi:hypothetical protein
MMLPLLPAQPTQRQPPTATTRGAKSCRRRPRLFPSRRPLPLPLPPQPQPRSSPAPPTSLTGILQHAVAPQRHTLTLTPLLPSSCSGYMMKQRRRWGLGPGLQQRWFLLDNCRLMWFAGELPGVPQTQECLALIAMPRRIMCIPLPLCFLRPVHLQTQPMQPSPPPSTTR